MEATTAVASAFDQDDAPPPYACDGPDLEKPGAASMRQPGFTATPAPGLAPTLAPVPTPAPAPAHAMYPAFNSAQGFPAIPQNMTMAPQMNPIAANGQLVMLELPRQQWEPDEARQGCNLCEMRFTFFKRRHHCRLCGILACEACSGRRHPLYASTRICKRCYSTVIAKAAGLHGMDWYHGPVSRSLAVVRLTHELAANGDFLVRESSSVDGFVCISIRVAPDSIQHILIRGSAGQWMTQRGGTAYPTIQKLIERMMESQMIKRPAAVLDSHGRPVAIIDSCPSCDFALPDRLARNAADDHPFCPNCGTRLRSTQAHLETYALYDHDDAGGVTASAPQEGMYSELDDNRVITNVPEPVSVPIHEPAGSAVEAVGATEAPAFSPTPVTNPLPQPAQAPATQPQSVPGGYSLPPVANLQQVHPNWQQDERLRLLSPLILNRAELSFRFGSLGKGASGNVKPATFRQEAVVIKQAHEGWEDAILHEAICLSGLHHPRVVKMIGLLLDHPRPALVMAEAQQGSLSRYLEKTSVKKVTPQVRLKFVTQICEALEFLASRTIAHGDLATRNVLLNSNTDCILGDFDLASWQGSVRKDYAERIAVRWIAPELLFKTALPTPCSDMWSYGVTCWEIYSHGSKPYGKMSLNDVRAALHAGTARLAPPQHIEEGAWHTLFAPCFLPPASRVTATAMRHILSTVTLPK
ncbi:uncharacterized protein MONBRDRAFT_32869 [Monosiga brevicollis MX1]|uniref:Non-specific protein-tyrosine kinase n=1 Tax=Monosiga brevicollis TaxID=81824 RepID=A9V271_MONBE|nr:uncharacterized protein MONBRDRAFT_32869 [Monosiga brevicollis MX1]EDQ88204.1 predicted protein [Monosiga brevicollis MX1]|eukprot:XP_001746797.1 hypothetical protein [Monosiga brevicollis MX1]